ncbi:MAG: acetate kinase [Elusimicrobiota bacterium]
MKILVLNCRVNSLEFEVYDMPQEKELCHGVIDKIGVESASIIYNSCNGRDTHREITAVLDHQRALEKIIQIISDKKIGIIKNVSEISAVGHRIVHGGEKYFESVKINEEVKKEIYRNFELAPLHNPYNFKGIEASEKLLGKIPNVAVFDTSYHQTIPEVAYRYPLPERLYQQYRIRKYGFHGISHRYVAERTAQFLKKPLKKLNMISLHLGQGCSLCAIKNGASVDTTMGFTPIEGIMMTTRSGTIGPGIIFFLQKSGWSVNDVETCLNRESGILGVSGISDDMKDVISAMKKGDKKAKLAVEMFVFRTRAFLGAYYIALESIDAIAFTGGIGVNSDLIRKMICSALIKQGLKLDEAKNKKAVDVEAVISASNSKIKVLVIPRNEKILIARDTYRIVKG